MSLRLSEDDYERLMKKRGKGKSTAAASYPADSYRLDIYANEAIAIGSLKYSASPLMVTLKVGVKALTRDDGKPKPYERIEQALALLWLQMNVPRAFEMATAMPMGGYRPDGAGGQLRGEGARAGYPDLLIDVPRNGFHGLRVEMKKYDRSAKPSDDQAGWLQRLANQGYKAVLCRGHQAAIQTMATYLGVAMEKPSLPDWAICQYEKIPGEEFVFA